MRKRRLSQAEGLTKHHPTGKWWSGDLSPAPGGSFYETKTTRFSLMVPCSWCQEEPSGYLFMAWVPGPEPMGDGRQ